MRTWTFRERHPTIDGPWKDEPDKAQWVDEATGLDCLIKRNHGGALCGYVGVPPGHQWHGKNYSDVNCDVHGGLTYSAFCEENAEEYGICHIPEPGRPADVWWLGFDCAHAFDLSPITEQHLKEAGFVSRVPKHSQWSRQYRDFAYVQGQVQSLARQVKETA